MAIIYLRSTNGTANADDGSTWALAKTGIVGAIQGTGLAAGSNVYTSSAHAESSGSVSCTMTGTVAAPLKIISANDSAEPPTAYAAGASVTSTSGDISFTSGSYHMRGFTLTAGTGGNTNQNIVLMSSGNHHVSLEDCSLILNTTNTNPHLYATGTGTTNQAAAFWKNVGVKFGATSQTIKVRDHLEWIGGSFLSGSSTNSSAVFNLLSGAAPVKISVTGVDFSNLSSTVNLVASASNVGTAVFRDCKMPSGWSGGLMNSAPSLPGFRAVAHNLDAGATNYKLWIEDYAGAIRDETTLVRTGGASDGVTGLAWKMTTNANAGEFGTKLVSGEIARRYPVAISEVAGWSAGASKTVTCEILHDSATALTDADIWLEAEYLGSSSSPLASIASNHRASLLATATNHASSSETWTTTGMTNPNKQKLVLTITPQQKGTLVLRVCLAKAGKTVYIDPKITIS